ncbi:hypothetical protein J2TS6_54710 [Paenibacillus albilobatus]|uniref:Uncharacterized protein n=1 Tax=Paenibacillus albilobatus TaxID=2716884 RepID=A0A920CCA0_9BACL|nr:hypothetical protein J2TS6_54710 [Paenibacillus albilobatus]
MHERSSPHAWVPFPVGFHITKKNALGVVYFEIYMERVMGIEPTLPAWKAGTAPSLWWSI